MHAAVAKLRPTLVIIDTLAALVEHLNDRPDPGSSTAWTPIMVALARIARDTNAAVVLLHHARKSDGKYRDSSAIGAGVDAIIEMSEGSGDRSVRHLRVRARWPVDDYSIRLIENRFELASGGLPLDKRVLQYIKAHPGCSMNGVRSGVTGKATTIGKEVRRLIDSGTVENRGDDKSMRLQALGGSRRRNHSDEEPVPDSGSPLVPRASQWGPGVVPTGQPLRVGRGTAPDSDSDVIEL